MDDIWCDSVIQPPIASSAGEDALRILDSLGHLVSEPQLSSLQC